MFDAVLAHFSFALRIRRYRAICHSLSGEIYCVLLYYCFTRSLYFFVLKIKHYFFLAKKLDKGLKIYFYLFRFLLVVSIFFFSRFYRFNSSKVMHLFVRLTTIGLNYYYYYFIENNLIFKKKPITIARSI